MRVSRISDITGDKIVQVEIEILLPDDTVNDLVIHGDDGDIVVQLKHRIVRRAMHNSCGDSEPERV